MNIKHLILGFSILTISVTSCLDSPETNSEWKIKNEEAFEAWRDSADMVAFDVPINRGGGTLLYRKITTVEIGKSPIFTDSIVVHYKGMYYSGTVFDGTYRDSLPNEYEIDKPAGFRVSSLIRGWMEGLQLMKEGEKFLFVFPTELGYGSSGNKVPAYSTLVFEVELIKVISSK